MKHENPKVHLTIKDLEKARKVFEKREPRSLFYRTATYLVERALEGEKSFTLVEALAVLLRTWNSAYYRFIKKFDEKHYRKLESVINNHIEHLKVYRKRRLDSFCDEDKPIVTNLFREFEIVLGPVGTAKCLHLLAPRFFPLWDSTIARKYRCCLGKGENADSYCKFIAITKEQCSCLGGEEALDYNILKAIDEYNYCKFTMEWI